MTALGHRADALVHRLAGEQALQRGHRLLDPVALEHAAGAAGLDRERFLAAVGHLAATGDVDVHLFGPSLVRLLRLTEVGLVRHLLTTYRDLDQVRARVLATIRAERDAGRLGEALDLAGMVGAPPLLVEVLLDQLRDRGDVVFTPLRGGKVRLHRVGRAEGVAGPITH